ncbi:hypothetical protein B0T14DRAFT_497324 [Immersiella caudata]|uniref:Uncharacterized protein n=1 Tax=Immersiella caudata TaxID=314043 RepID=A0AA39WSP4_9PEZI|nr:hypothetical protein B0T14DRAFT_497324 [Immersiella caudata]
MDPNWRRAAAAQQAQHNLEAPMVNHRQFSTSTTRTPYDAILTELIHSFDPQALSAHQALMVSQNTFHQPLPAPVPQAAFASPTQAQFRAPAEEYELYGRVLQRVPMPQQFLVPTPMAMTPEQLQAPPAIPNAQQFPVLLAMPIAQQYPNMPAIPVVQDSPVPHSTPIVQQSPVPQMAPNIQRPTMAELLEQKDHKYAPLFSNRAEMEALRREFEAECDKTDLRETDASLDPDFPAMNTEREKECAEILFNAITDFSNVKELKTHVHYGRVKNLRNLEVHFLSYDLLDAIKDAHCGRLGFSPRTWENEWRYQSFETFTARLQAVAGACAYSKSVVYGNLPAEYRRRVASAPSREVTAKRRNTDGNAEKAVQIKAGRGVVKAARGEKESTTAAQAAGHRTKGGRVRKPSATAGRRRSSASIANSVASSLTNTAASSPVASSALDDDDVDSKMAEAADEQPDKAADQQMGGAPLPFNPDSPFADFINGNSFSR